MPINPTYSVGTVTVSANGLVVTGSGTQFAAAGIETGDIFEHGGLTVTIQSADSPTQLTLTKPWPGAALSGAIYEVRYTPDASRVIVNAQLAIQAFDGLSRQLSPVEATITVTVGASGDYPTITAALAYLSARAARRYQSAGVRGVVRLLPGFVVAEQIVVRDGMDLSWVEITADVVPVTISRVALTSAVAAGNDADYPVFSAINSARLPRISCLFSMDTSGVGTGRTFMYLENQSAGFISAGGGCLNAGGRGCEARNQSRALITNAIFTGAAGRALYAVHGSEIVAENVNVSNCTGDIAIYALHRSSIDFRAGVANQCAGVTVMANYGADIDMPNATVTQNLGATAVSSRRGSRIDAADVNASGAAADGFESWLGSTINANGANANTSGRYGFYAMDGARINANGATATGCGTYAAYASHGSFMNFRSSTATGAGVRGVYAERGSEINANLTNARRGAADDSTQATGDFVCLSNSTLRILGATGGCNLSPHTLQSAGVVFR